MRAVTSTGGTRGTGRLARLLRFLVTHQVPVGGDPAPPARLRPGRPTVGLVACHWVAGGYGDQVVSRVEQALDQRGHGIGPLAAVDRQAPVVVVAHAGPRARPALPAVGVDVATLAGRPVGLVVYGPAPAPDPASLDALRAELSAAGAHVAVVAVLFDTARLHRPAAMSRSPVTATVSDPHAGGDPFALLTLELVLDGLLAGGPSPDDGVDAPCAGCDPDRRAGPA